MGNQDDYSGWDRHFFDRGKAAPRFVGMDRASAEQLAAVQGVTAIRVADLDDDPRIALHTDFRPDRLTLLVHHGKVVRAGFF